MIEKTIRWREWADIGPFGSGPLQIYSDSHMDPIALSIIGIWN